MGSDTYSLYILGAGSLSEAQSLHFWKEELQCTYFTTRKVRTARLENIWKLLFKWKRTKKSENEETQNKP